jgi:hypothetical protein
MVSFSFIHNIVHLHGLSWTTSDLPRETMRFDSQKSTITKIKTPSFVAVPHF